MDAVRKGSAATCRRQGERRLALGLLVAALVVSLCAASGAQSADATAHGAERGWDYLVEKLARDGVDRRRVQRVFADPRMEPFTGLEFGLRPREPSALYRGFTKPASVALARRCKAAHEPALGAAEQAFGVPASIVAAILHIESGCGRNTGSEVVLYRLARLAMANEPANLKSNIERHRALSDEPNVEEVARQRGQYLEDTFYPEVLATFQMSDRLDIDPLGLRGSGSGAFGMPQFLPRSYLSYGADGNDDGRISLYDPDDAIFSCANYLALHGWKSGLTRAQQRRVIWHYNRSDAYIDAVLALADRLDGASEATAPPWRSAAAKKSAAPARKKQAVPAKTASSKRKSSSKAAN